VLKLPPDETNHVHNVLRGRNGDFIEVVDGEGRLFTARLCSGGEAAVVEELEAPGRTGVEISLYQAVPKGGRMDLVVEKATEVGATRIVPLLAERGVVTPRAGKVGRWRRVAEAAARQALRLSVPEVAEPVRFEDAASEVGETGVLLHNAPALQPIEAVVDGARESCCSPRRLASRSVCWDRTGSAARPPVSSRWRVRWLHWRAGSNVIGGALERGGLHIL
jgi:16S rRNA (uracil1498-N3)-methyltransferase